MIWDYIVNRSSAKSFIQATNGKRQLCIITTLGIISSKHREPSIYIDESCIIVVRSRTWKASLLIATSMYWAWKLSKAVSLVGENEPIYGRWRWHRIYLNWCELSRTRMSAVLTIVMAFLILYQTLYIENNFLLKALSRWHNEIYHRANIIGNKTTCRPIIKLVKKKKKIEFNCSNEHWLQHTSSCCIHIMSTIVREDKNWSRSIIKITTTLSTSIL